MNRREHTSLIINGEYTEVTLIHKANGTVSIVFKDGQILRSTAADIDALRA